MGKRKHLLSPSYIVTKCEGKTKRKEEDAVSMQGDLEIASFNKFPKLAPTFLGQIPRTNRAQA
jgi:hypothetical protein